MPRARQLSTRLIASERQEACSSPASHAFLMSSISSLCCGERRSNQFGGFRFSQAPAATASRRLDEPIAEGVEDAGEVAANLGDGFF